MAKLYFYWRKPTEAQRKEAESLGALLRDARAARAESNGDCSEAFGMVPDTYKAYQSKPKPTKKKASKKAK